MNITRAEIYLFRATQMGAFLLSPFLYLLAFLTIAVAATIFVVTIVVIGILLAPLLFALMILDLASDFSRSYQSDVFGKYMDGVLFLPEMLWDALCWFFDKALFVARSTLAYARGEDENAFFS